MFDTFPRYDVFKNTAIYFCNVKIYYTIDLWSDFSDLFLLPGNAGCASALLLTDHLP